jgi:hypothetical protein
MRHAARNPRQATAAQFSGPFNQPLKPVTYAQSAGARCFKTRINAEGRASRKTVCASGEVLLPALLSSPSRETLDKGGNPVLEGLK